MQLHFLELATCILWQQQCSILLHCYNSLRFIDKSSNYYYYYYYYCEVCTQSFCELWWL